MNILLLPDDVLASIVDDMNRRGFGVATDCVDQNSLTSIRLFIENKVADNGGEYIVLRGLEPVRGTSLETLSLSPYFMQICKTIYENGTGRSAPTTPKVPFYQVLRCISGEMGKKDAFRFHYDSYILTVLIPIIIPSEGTHGDLIMVPNARMIRKSYGRNLIDKALLGNKLAQVILKTLTTTGPLLTKVRLQPGNIYFFWGYRSIHASEPCEPTKIRATAIFHYVDPHASSWLQRILRGRKPA
jgi:hypothetical protein